MTELWHQLRAQNIGGSDIAALFGECPYSSRYKLWHQRKGNLIADDLENDERVQAGRFQEPAAIAWANWKWGMDFYQPAVYVVHPAVQGMGCTPDAFSRYDETIMAQVKIVDSLRFAEEWDYDGETITKGPLHILLQVQHELECCQRDESWLIVMVGGNRIYKMICKRDEEAAEILRKEVISFWKSIEDNIEPVPQFDRDGDSIRHLRKRLPAMEVLDLTGNEYFRKLARDCLDATVQRNRLNDELEAINAEICHIAGNAQVVKCDGLTLKFYPHLKNPKITTEGVSL